MTKDWDAIKNLRHPEERSRRRPERVSKDAKRRCNIPRLDSWRAPVNGEAWPMMPSW
jgi:hypothetical protein